MNLSAPFIRRPIATVLLTAGLLILGAISFMRLPIASVPAVERPTITVTAQLPGASAETIGSAVAQPLERQLGTIPGIVEMSSYSGSGGTQIQIQFELSKSIDAAAGDVQAAINAAIPNLPKTLPFPPSYRKANASGFAPVALALTSDVLTPGEIYDFADTVVSQKLSALSGVAQTIVAGGDKSAVRITVDPRRLANMGLSLEQVRVAIRGATANMPKGHIDIDHQSFAVTANDQLTRPEEYADIVLAYRNGAPVRLRDVGRASDSVINNEVAGWYNDRRAVLVFVLKQPEANVVDIVDAVKGMLPQLHHWLPPALKVDVVYDRTAMIRASLAHALMSIEVAVLLAVAVVAFVLRRLRATVIPVLTIPSVLAIALVGIDAAGYSLNNLSLMAIIIAIGFIVDDAVIVVENIIRRMENGEEAATASLNGAGQMGFTIVSISAALLAALLPILFMPDVIGRFFREFGGTLVLALVASALVSLTLTPVLSSLLLKPSPAAEGKTARRDSFVVAFYLRGLQWGLRHRYVMAALLVVSAISSAGLYLVLPKGFMPTQDIGLFSIRTVTISNVSFAAMEELQRTVTKAVLRDPAVESVSSFVGKGTGSSLSTGSMYVSLKPFEEREPIGQVIARLRRELAQIPGVLSFFTPWQDLVLGIQNTAARYQYTLSGADPDQLWQWSEQMRRRMRAMPQLADVVTSAERAGLEARLTINRERASAFGITPLAIDNTLYDAFGQRWVKIIYLPFNTTESVMEVEPSMQENPSALNDIFVPGADNAQIPLAAVTQQRRAHAAMWIRHSGQFPSINLSFDTKPGVAIGDAIAAIRAAERELRLPDGIRAEFRGEASEATKTRTQQMVLFLGAVFAIYIVLGMLYESCAHPLTVLATLPPAALGSLLALFVTGTEFSLVAAIACILAVGIAMKNAIIMVDFALAAERQEGLPAAAAITLAAKARFRPIMMTSLIAVLGAVPLVVAGGAGQELRQPLGIATIGGLIVSQLLALYTTPVIYLFVDRLRSVRRRRPSALLPAPRVSA